MAIIVQAPAITKEQRSPSQKKEMPVVESSFIQNFSYDAQSQQLTVTMKTGGTYVHPEVSLGVWEQLIKAPSKGSFYAHAIKGRTPATRTVTKTVGPALPKAYQEEEKGDD